MCLEYEVEEIVLGFPKNMNNTTGDRAEKSLEFAEMLKKRTGLPVVMWDERLTTVAAEQVLMESGAKRASERVCGSDRCIHDFAGISGLSKNRSE